MLAVTVGQDIIFTNCIIFILIIWRIEERFCGPHATRETYIMRARAGNFQ